MPHHREFLTPASTMDRPLSFFNSNDNSLRPSVICLKFVEQASIAPLDFMFFFGNGMCYALVRRLDFEFVSLTIQLLRVSTKRDVVQCQTPASPLDFDWTRRLSCRLLPILFGHQG